MPIPEFPAGAAVELYEVTVSRSASFVVLASSRAEAREIAAEAASDELDDFVTTDVDVEGTIEPGSPEATRYGGDIPYGLEDVSDEDHTVSEILSGALMDEALFVSEKIGPVHWCERCLRVRVQFDWRNEQQVCRGCREEAEVERLSTITYAGQGVA